MKDKNVANRHNILFIMADQFRFDYLGCAGADFVSTPNLDALAQRGVRFNYCCTNSPICAPARIGLATGLQPSRVGAVDNDAYLPLNVKTYYQRLRDYGYQVGCTGKLDLAKPSTYNGRNGNRPCIYSYGFTLPVECEGKNHAFKFSEPMGPYGAYLESKGLYKKARDYRKSLKTFYERNASDSNLEEEDFEDVYIGRRAVEWINNITNEYPWHLFVSFVGPHAPFDPPTSYAEQFRGKSVPAPVKDDYSGKPQYVKKKDRGLSDEEVEKTRRQYCAAIKVVDNQIGQIIDTLKKRGMYDNTYIVFSSDHGEMLGDHGLYGKSVPYDPSIRIPLIAAGPGIKGGRVSDALVELIDINPTICELAGLPPQNEIDAKSFCNVLYGESDQGREEMVNILSKFKCIRTREYKYIYNHNSIQELYDLKNDPDELNNIAYLNPELAEELHDRMIKRYQEGKWLY